MDSLLWALCTHSVQIRKKLSERERRTQKSHQGFLRSYDEDANKLGGGGGCVLPS